MKLVSHMSKLRDHLAAFAAALACAHTIGLIRLHALVPQADLMMQGPGGQLMGVALCALAYAIMLSRLYRRRLVAGPLYLCGATRADEDYDEPYHPGTSQLLQGWHYR